MHKALLHVIRIYSPAVLAAPIFPYVSGYQIVYGQLERSLFLSLHGSLLSFS
jgi:hypothetical protein